MSNLMPNSLVKAVSKRFACSELHAAGRYDLAMQLIREYYEERKLQATKNLTDEQLIREEELRVIPERWLTFLEELREFAGLNTNKTKEENMKNVLELEAKKLKWIAGIVGAGANYDVEELEEMTMKEIAEVYSLHCEEAIEIREDRNGNVRQVKHELPKPAIDKIAA